MLCGYDYSINFIILSTPIEIATEILMKAGCSNSTTRFNIFKNSDIKTRHRLLLKLAIFMRTTRKNSISPQLLHSLDKLSSEAEPIQFVSHRFCDWRPKVSAALPTLISCTLEYHFEPNLSVIAFQICSCER